MPLLRKKKWHERLPIPLNWLYLGWMQVGKAIGAVTSRIVLTALWIVGFGVYAIPMKLLRKKETKNPETYWRDVRPEPPENMLRQF